VTVMIAHGLLAALTFALSGYIYEQTGTLEIRKLGGLLRALPFVGTAFIIAAMAGCGLPGFANFIGEFLVLFGAWKSVGVSSEANAINWFVVAAVWGALVIGAVYMLRAVRNVLHGPEREELASVRDAGFDSLRGFAWWRKLPFALLIATLLIFGFAPRLLTERIEPSATRIVEFVTGKPEKTKPKAVAHVSDTKR
jgi:NADH-quinone oxidoreductase subunit M